MNGELWPVGHPTIYIGKEVEWGPDNWFGLAKVSILPPRGLLHPVLPEKSASGKVLFHLCSACAREESQGPCIHSDEERAIHGTFFTGELDLAVEMGYRLLKTYELWHWPPKQRSKELFLGLILDQFRKKVLASEPPSDPAKRRQLISDLAKLNINVQDGDWAVNKAMRALAKFSLNNIW